MTRVFIASLLMACVAAATVRSTDGSQADVASKISASSDGDTVQIPSGSFTWTSGITISGKGIKLEGAGAGRVEGSSTSSLAIGTGTKAFAVTNTITGFTNGETVRAVYKADGTAFMEGTVTSWSGGTLTLNVTSTGGSGTKASWNFVMPATTTITHSASTSSLIAITEDATHRVELTGFRIVYGTGSGNAIDIDNTSGGKAVLVHDIRVTSDGPRIMDVHTNRGVFWRLYFDSGFIFGSVTNITTGGIVVKSTIAASWSSASTMGTADATGESNVYVEDSYFAGLLTQCFDFDDCSRTTVRHCVLDNSGMTSHGADTSNYGNRHFEVVDNVFLFDSLGADTGNLNYWIFIRGGTGVITGNVMPDITSGEWGAKPEITLTVQNLQRNAGPHPLWGAGIGGVQYPAPRQVGMGYITGASASDSFAYNGDAEPFYQWGNTGTGAFASPGITNYEDPEAGEDDVSDYIQVGRDWLNATKVGWAEYTYPHPLRGEDAGASGSTSTFSGSGSTTIGGGSGSTTIQ